MAATLTKDVTLHSAQSALVHENMPPRDHFMSGATMFWFVNVIQKKAHYLGYNTLGKIVETTEKDLDTLCLHGCKNLMD